MFIHFEMELVDTPPFVTFALYFLHFLSTRKGLIRTFINIFEEKITFEADTHKLKRLFSSPKPVLNIL